MKKSRSIATATNKIFDKFLNEIKQVFNEEHDDQRFIELEGQGSPQQIIEVEEEEKQA